MIRQTLHQLRPFVDRITRQRALSLAGSATLAGVMEAGALLLTVGVATSLASSDDDPLDLPLLGQRPAGQVLVVAAVCAVLSLALHALNAFLAADIASRVLHSARTRAIRSYTAAGWPTQAMQREGSLQETVSTLGVRTSHLTEALTNGAVQLLSLVVFLGTAMLIDIAAASVVVVMGVALVACMKPISRATRRRSRAWVDANSAFAEDVSKLASTSMELRVFGVQEVAAGALEQQSWKVRLKQLRARFALLLGTAMYKDLAVLLLIACIGGLVLAGSNEVDSLAVVVALMVRALSFAQGTNNAYQSLNEGISNAVVLNERIGVLDAGALPTGDQQLPALAAIELHDVTYRYNEDVVGLDRVSLELGTGEALGVVGPSGGGKSTFVQVLLRLRPPTEGVVTIRGTDYMSFGDKEWAQRIALVPQEPTLIEGTISDNIRYYRQIPQDAVERAAVEAHVYDEIMRLPSGFDTMLGPRGSGLSGGQKQRVAIARALVGGPELLVMDEPSSALDVHSEQRLQRTIEGLKGSITMVIVAHRMQTVESCDRLLVLERGRIAQLGPPDELMQSEGFYRRVVETLHGAR
jgi:ATP-binding cassette subfamily B protein